MPNLGKMSLNVGQKFDGPPNRPEWYRFLIQFVQLRPQASRRLSRSGNNLTRLLIPFGFHQIQYAPNR